MALGLCRHRSIGITQLDRVEKQMPSQQVSVTKQPFSYLLMILKGVYQPPFLGLSLALPLVGMPLMLWIALSPIILVDELKLTSVQYGLAQFPYFWV